MIIKRLGAGLSLLCMFSLVGCNVDGTGLLGGSEARDDNRAARRALDRPDGDVAEGRSPIEDQVLQLVNMERFGVGAVKPDPRLAALAEDYACTMIGDGFFGHVNPRTTMGLAERVAAAGYEFDVVGENLALGMTTAAAIVDAWLESPAHREILLDAEFTHVGIAARDDEVHHLYCVMILARPTEP